MSDNVFHRQVIAEMRRGEVVESMWDRANSLTPDRGERRNIIYSEMRVTQLARDTRKVKIVAAHRRKRYGFNLVMLLGGWVPLLGAFYLIKKNVSGRAIFVTLMVNSFIVAALGALVYTGATRVSWFLVAAMVLLGLLALSYFANRWIVESIEPLKTTMREVNSKDVVAHLKDRRVVIDTAAATSGLKSLARSY